MLLIGWGTIAFTRLPIEAYPELSDVQVQVITLFPGHAAEEVEKFVTIPIENEINGTPRLTAVRSTSIFGLSVVRAIFEDGTDDYFARQQVLERHPARLTLPPGVDPDLGPLSGSIGEILRYTLKSDTLNLIELKALQDWVLERRFRQVPGVVDVVSWGGGLKQYQVQLDPAKLTQYDLTFKQVFDALSASNANAGGSYIPQGDYAYMVRGLGLLGSTADIDNVVVAAHDGTPVRIKDIGQAAIGHGIRLGILGTRPRRRPRPGHHPDAQGRECLGGAGAGQSQARRAARHPACRRHDPAVLRSQPPGADDGAHRRGEPDQGRVARAASS